MKFHKKGDSLIPPPPPRSTSKHIDLTRYMHETVVGSRSSNTSPTTSEFTRIYDNIVEPTANLNISDLESIFSTNTAYSETTTQTTVDPIPSITHEIMDFENLPPPPHLPSLNEIIKSYEEKFRKINDNQKHDDRDLTNQPQSPTNIRSEIQLIDKITCSNDNEAKIAISTIIPTDLTKSHNYITTDLNNKNNDDDDANTIRECTDTKCSDLLFDLNNKNNNDVTCCNNNFDCQIMTNCGNENVDMDATGVSADNDRENDEMVKLAERIKGMKSGCGLRLLLFLCFLVIN